MMSIAEMVAFWARWQPDAVAVSRDHQPTTWRELDSHARRLAGGLRQLGVDEGDRVGVAMESSVEFVELVVGALYAGVVLVPFNPQLTASEVAFQAGDAKCRALVASSSLVASLAQARAEQPSVPVVVAGAETPKGNHAFEELIARSDPFEPVRVRDADRPMIIVYTSGTTGKPKGAVLTHGSLGSAVIGRTLPYGITNRDTILVPYALSISSGIMQTMLTLWTGAHLISEDPFDPARCLEAVGEGVTVFMAANVFWERMLAHPDFATTDFSSLRVALTGGSPVSEALLTAYLERGVPLLETFGMTEMSMNGFTVAPVDARRKLGWAGQPGPFTQVRILDHEAKELPRGEVGELCVSSPDLMAGYWNNPEANRARMVDGWYHSGDLAKMDDEGYIKAIGRMGDMIISGGFNIYPAELEDVLAAGARFTEASVIGVPDAQWGESPAVVVFSEGKPVDPREVLDQLEGKVARYKLPRYLLVLDEPLPRNATGKIIKRKLQDAFETFGDKESLRIR